MWKPNLYKYFQTVQMTQQNVYLSEKELLRPGIIKFLTQKTLCWMMNDPDGEYIGTQAWGTKFISLAHIWNHTYGRMHLSFLTCVAIEVNAVELCGKQWWANMANRANSRWSEKPCLQKKGGVHVSKDAVMCGMHCFSMVIHSLALSISLPSLLQWSLLAEWKSNFFRNVVPAKPPHSSVECPTPVYDLAALSRLSEFEKST